MKHTNVKNEKAQILNQIQNLLNTTEFENLRYTIKQIIKDIDKIAPHTRVYDPLYHSVVNTFYNTFSWAEDFNWNRTKGEFDDNFKQIEEYNKRVEEFKKEFSL